MKHIFLLTTGLVALAACNDTSGQDGKTESTLRADCIVVANDTEGQEEIAEIGTNADGFCDCVVTLTGAMPEEDAQSVETIMHKVAFDMQETGRGTEDVVGEMMSVASANPGDMDAQATRSGIALVGDMFDDISDGFEETGSCPSG